MSTRTDQGVITKLEKLLGSFSWRVTLDNGNSYQTVPNSMVSYEIDNSVYRGVTVQLSLTDRFRVFDITVI
jgi:hypothetical protein